MGSESIHHFYNRVDENDYYRAVKFSALTILDQPKYLIIDIPIDQCPFKIPYSVRKIFYYFRRKWIVIPMYKGIVMNVHSDPFFNWLKPLCAKDGMVYPSYCRGIDIPEHIKRVYAFGDYDWHGEISIDGSQDGHFCPNSPQDDSRERITTLPDEIEELIGYFNPFNVRSILQMYPSIKIIGIKEPIDDNSNLDQLIQLKVDFPHVTFIPVRGFVDELISKVCNSLFPTVDVNSFSLQRIFQR